MVLKDWEKIDRIYPYWVNSKTEYEVSIIKTSQIKEKYFVQYGDFLNQQRKFFMTRSEAFKFAKAYMKTH